MILVSSRQISGKSALQFFNFTAHMYVVGARNVSLGGARQLVGSHLRRNMRLLVARRTYSVTMAMVLISVL